MVVGHSMPDCGTLAAMDKERLVGKEQSKHDDRTALEDNHLKALADSHPKMLVDRHLKMLVDKPGKALVDKEQSGRYKASALKVQQAFGDDSNEH